MRASLRSRLARTTAKNPNIASETIGILNPALPSMPVCQGGMTAGTKMAIRVRLATIGRARP
jgi:hypothetical protein